NPAGLALLEAPDLDTLRQLDFAERIEPEFRAAFCQQKGETFGGRPGRLRYALRSLEGNGRWVDQSCVPLRDEAGRIDAALISARDVTPQVQAETERQHLQGLLVEQLRSEAMADKLTGLPNRRMFNERLAEAMSRAGAAPGHHAAVLFLDFDRFKVINDSLGHEIGDL